MAFRLNTPAHLPFQAKGETFNYVESCFQQFLQTIKKPDIGFFSLATEKKFLQQCKDLHARFKERTHFVQVGIGGSSLGPEMVLSALQSPENKTSFTFINNIDSEKLHDQMLKLDPHKVLFYIVSKSGGTAETMAAFVIATEWLKEKGISEKDFSRYFVFATDPEKGDLRPLAKELGISCLDIPSNVGGRYSVFTAVGLFPALFAGINCDAMLDGAAELGKMIVSEKGMHNPLISATGHLYQLLKEQNISQTVFMPYSSKLKDFSAWFVQLWAESLGKKNSLKGEVVYRGLTPIASYGATDQHSQVQLFMEGPKDKAIVFIEIAHPAHDYSLKNSFQIKSLEKLAPHTLNKLMTAELQGTLKALDEIKRPYLHLVIDKNDAHHLGMMVMFFECLTVIMGHCLDIDPFDQPGVEAGKIYAFEFLKH